MNKQIELHIDKIMKEYKVQSVGDGYINCICPLENISFFLDEMKKINIKVPHFTLWEYVSDRNLNSVIGMGGPLNNYGNGWYSELLEDYFEYQGECNLKEILQEVSQKYKCEIIPAFWLDIKKSNY